MKQFDRSILEAIGDTPIVKLSKVANDTKSEIYVKLEYMNPGGSIKDRIGKYMMEQAVKNGQLKPGGTIIEGTSGNTGVGLAMYAAVHGFKAIFVLADKQSQEKINNLRAFGAKVIVCPTNVEPEDPRSYYSVSKRLAHTIPNSFYVNQYDNFTNRETHEKFTGPEIYEQTKGEFDVFVAGVGTGGTITGCSKFLKSKMPHMKTVAVDCQGSILTHYFKTGEMIPGSSYVLEGIGEDFIPKNYDFDYIDEFVMVGDKESFVMTRALLAQEGIYAGGSSGAAVVGAIKYAKTLPEPKKILVILPDSGNRYASKIYNDDWMRDKGYNDSSFNVIIKDVMDSLRSSKPKISSVEDTATIQDVIKLMQEHDVSQVPIYSQGLIKGVVSEKNLLRPVYEGKLKFSDSISLVTSDRYSVFDSHDLLSNVTEALLKKDIVLIMENNKIMDILTDIDILQYISTKGSY